MIGDNRSISIKFTGKGEIAKGVMLKASV
jgi:hypothetical protein